MATQCRLAAAGRAGPARTPGRAALALALMLAGCDSPAMMTIRDALDRAGDNITGAFRDPAPSRQGGDGATDPAAAAAAPSGASHPLDRLPPSEVDAGVRDLMAAAVARALPVLSHGNGFATAYRIGLPPGLLEVREALASIGLSRAADDLEDRLTQAAGLAVIDLKPLVTARIAAVPIVDAAAIVTGPPDAATRHLEFNSAIELLEAGRPVVAAALARSGADPARDATLALYRQHFPGRPLPAVDLADHVVQGLVGGLFIEAGIQEQTVRDTPSARQTPRLSALFGGT